MTSIIEKVVLPTVQESKIAREASRKFSMLRTVDHLQISVHSAEVDNPTSIDLPGVVVGMLTRIFSEMAEGNAIALVPIKAELTIQEAA